MLIISHLRIGIGQGAAGAGGEAPSARQLCSKAMSLLRSLRVWIPGFYKEAAPTELSRRRGQEGKRRWRARTPRRPPGRLPRLKSVRRDAERGGRDDRAPGTNHCGEGRAGKVFFCGFDFHGEYWWYCWRYLFMQKNYAVSALWQRAFDDAGMRDWAFELRQQLIAP